MMKLTMTIPGIGRAPMRRVARAISIVRVASAAMTALALWAVTPAAAFAQEFQKVEGKLADDIPAVPFVGIAYGFIWLAVLVYVAVLARGLGRVKTEIDDLRRKLDGAGTPRK